MTHVVVKYYSRDVSEKNQTDLNQFGQNFRKNKPYISRISRHLPNSRFFRIASVPGDFPRTCATGPFQVAAEVSFRRIDIYENQADFVRETNTYCTLFTALEIF